jgi:molecular chaperone HscC
MDNVLLVRGANRMPVVHRLVAELFGRPARTELDPDQVVALEAAVPAAHVLDSRPVEDIVLTDVGPITLGLEIVKKFGSRREDGYLHRALHRNTTIPVSREECFSTVYQ